uniref:Uncharacterized protein n=1 Tax=Anguilla anguilla TaxID=7936 RepID=A0A0E9VHH9_ANGAN
MLLWLGPYLQNKYDWSVLNRGNYKQGTSIGNKYNLSLHFSNMEINCEQRCVYILFRWLPSRLENYGQLTETLSLEKQVVDST